MNTPGILTCDDLRLITGYRRAGDVARCLRDQGVHVFSGRGGPWTTIDLINKAGGLNPSGGDDQGDRTLEAEDIL